MYAVLVLAAILLSVAPMHARTLLAALPASAPGHQLACDGLDGSQEDADDARHPRLHPTTARQQHLHLIQLRLPASLRETSATASRPATLSLLPPAALGALEHAPNAP